ncbi:MAG TPA: DUF1295 domain-containing protein [Mesorhizobium sp.]|uniref:DUF1295 domain-containing protein n=1 Tax=Mesorhizobium sp. TaxID=1871066 RepID=UPI002DDD25D0|nr:DUF1295 domain-containing protein [Mesorhizobium sp.]HEV2503661.1 DUF1295 domain-containing protein [Mesorhizobium sp.]
MTAAIIVVTLAACLSATMAAGWLVALWTGRSGWIDAIWSFATGAAAAGAALVPFSGSEISARQTLVAALALAWSLRLGLHICARTMSDGDDPRYQHLREEWGVSFKCRLFWFLQIQALASLVLAIAILVAAHNPAPGLGVSDWLGLALLTLAVAGEAIADRQLSAFRSDPANQRAICDIGLWGIMRHPNYFFEWLGWSAYAVIAIDLSGDYPLGWVTLTAPLLMYWLLVHVSGIPPLEAHMLRSRGAAFSDYQARVNAFWPGPHHRSRAKPAGLVR